MSIILKDLEEIKNNPWLCSGKNIENSQLSQTVWDYTNSIKLDDIVFWEQLYFQPGNIGVYAAYDPYVEFYIIVYNLFANLEQGIETFYGAGANKKVWDRANRLGVILPVETIWISKKEENLYHSIN